MRPFGEPATRCPARPRISRSGAPCGSPWRGGLRCGDRGRRRSRRSKPRSTSATTSAARRLTAEIDVLKAKIRRIPYIDPVDIRYRRFESEPKPVAQAVMFCLMDVSGSMSEHMKDLAKRFYMLLYVFLTRRYRHVEIVFIRHTDRAEEVDEETFFRSPATGGTLVSSALEAMRDIVARALSAGRLEHLCGAGLGRRQLPCRRGNDRTAARARDPAGQPVFRLSRGRRVRAIRCDAGFAAVDALRAPARRRARRSRCAR